MIDNNLLDLELEEKNLNNYSYASFGDRLGAAFIDGFILAIPNYIITYIFPSTLSDIASFVMYWLYNALMISSEKQATFGKQALNLIVTDLDGQRIDFVKASVRYISTFISAIILLIGFLMQPFTEKRQALHDMIAGTLVYKL